MVGFNEHQKVAAISKVFADSYKSPESVIVVDNVERLLGALLDLASIYGVIKFLFRLGPSRVKILQCRPADIISAFCTATTQGQLMDRGL